MGVVIWGMSGLDAVVLGGQAGGGGFTDPTSISGLQLWLKADAGAYKDLGSTLAGSGDSVEQWNDQSGNANNATQTTAGQRPVYATGSINGKPTLGDVNGGSTNMALGSGIAFTGAFTLYAVGQKNTGQNWTALSNGGGSAGMILFSDGNLYFVNDGGSFVSAAANPTANTPFAVRIRRDGSNVVKLTLTGGAEATVGTLSGTLTINAILARAGAGQYGDASELFGEIALYNVATNSTDDGNMSTYFNGRWGVSLP